MENMLHSTPSHASLPDCFVFPPDQLPPATSAAVSLPVIDMSRSRDEVRRAILDAGKELGFFQVVNHGVSEQTLQDMEAVCEEFFQLPAAEKADFYSEDLNRPNRLFSGTTYETGGEKYWRDCLRLACPFPVGDSTNDWPDKPPRLREVIKKSTVLTLRPATRSCEQWDAEEHRAPRDDQLGAGADVDGDVHHADRRLPHRPGGGVPRRGQPAVLPHPHVPRLHAHLQCSETGVIAQSHNQSQGRSEGDMKRIQKVLQDLMIFSSFQIVKSLQYWT